MNQLDIEDFQWTYSIGLEGLNEKPLAMFMRLSEATEALKDLQKHYPDMKLTVYVRGDQSYYGVPGAHHQTH